MSTMRSRLCRALVLAIRRNCPIGQGGLNTICQNACTQWSREEVGIYFQFYGLDQFFLFSAVVRQIVALLMS